MYRSRFIHFINPPQNKHIRHTTCSQIFGDHSELLSNEIAYQPFEPYSPLTHLHFSEGVKGGIGALACYKKLNSIWIHNEVMGYEKADDISKKGS